MAGVMQHEVKLSESGEKCLLVGVEQEMATLVRQDRSFIRRPIDMLESISYPCDIEAIANIRSISGMSNRAITALENNYITTLPELQALTYREVQRLDGIGPQTAKDIREVLRMHGLKLKATKRDQQVQS